MPVFRLLDNAEVPWTTLDSFHDRTVFQTEPWLKFIAETQGASPVVAEIRDGGEVAGYFTGLVIRRCGVKILGSSFPGWTTPYIGFNLVPGYPRRRLLDGIAEFAFDELGCWHMEISDRFLDPKDAEGSKFDLRFQESFETDLAQPEEKILASMETDRRYYIRRASKTGLIMERATDAGFADEYYDQLVEVFSKHRLPPTYGLDRVRSLVRTMAPTDYVLFLRARDPADGRCVATGIFPGMNRIADYWGGASYRSGLRLHPNEALLWHAMMYWRDRGITVFDWGGGGDYKRRYGPVERPIVWLSRSRYGFISPMRDVARGLFDFAQRMTYRMRGRASEPESP
jgi:hypothetical protein